MTIFYIYLFFTCALKSLSADNTTATVRPTLNTNVQLSQFWIITTITVPQTSSNDIIQNVSFTYTMEDKLATAYNNAFNILLARNSRKKRAASVNSVTLQIISVKRSVNTNNVDITYYVQQGGSLVTSTVAVSTMNVLTAQQLAIQLGYPVVTVAQSYEATLITSNNQAWIIGVVLGSLAGILLIIWFVLFIYCRCLIPQPKLIMPDEFNDDGLVESEKNDREKLTQQHVLSSDGQENYSGKASLAKNVNLAFIVDEVALKLDSKVAELVKSRVFEELNEEKPHKRRQASLSPSDESLPNDDAYATLHRGRKRPAHKKHKSTVSSRQIDESRRQTFMLESEFEVPQKSDIERWRNKQRLREKKSDDLDVVDISEEQYDQPYTNDETASIRKIDSSRSYHDSESIVKSVNVQSEKSSAILIKDEFDGDLLEEVKSPNEASKHLPIQVKTSLRPDALRTADLVNSFSEAYELATICEKINTDSSKQPAYQIIDVRSKSTPPLSVLNESSSRTNEVDVAANPSKSYSPRKNGDIIQVTSKPIERDAQQKLSSRKGDIIHVSPAPVLPIFKEHSTSFVSESPNHSIVAEPNRRLNDKLTDEMDIVSTVTFAEASRSGTDAKHLVNSIRAELDRLKQNSEYSTA